MSKSASPQILQTATKDLTKAPNGILQRKCAACGTHTVAGDKCNECQKRVLQRKSSSNSGTSETPSIVQEVLRTSGQPLDESAKMFFESRFNQDFSRVRVHTNAKAAESAQAVNALAYTVGNNIVFGAGQYSRALSDKHLLAHELVHTLQQSKGMKSTQLSSRSLSISHPKDPLEQEADAIADRVLAGTFTTLKSNRSSVLSRRAAPVIQRQVSEESAESSGQEGKAAEQSSGEQNQSWKRGQSFGPPMQLPFEEAARRVNSALDVMTGLTYVKRPPSYSAPIAALGPGEISSENEPTIQTFPANFIQRAASGSSPLAKVHGGVVGSIQACWDLMSGEASLKGWIWAGVGYDAPFIGWVGGYFFGEKTWWKGNLLKVIEPGECNPACNAKHEGDGKSGFGIAGFPIDIKPKQRARFSKAGLEVGFLLTPNSWCDADFEAIALLNILSYLGPVATVATKAVEGINTFTRDSPHVTLEAGIDFSGATHLCRSVRGSLTANHFEFCGGGYVGAGIGLSHTKSENHGAS